MNIIIIRKSQCCAEDLSATYDYCHSVHFSSASVYSELVAAGVGVSNLVKSIPSNPTEVAYTYENVIGLKDFGRMVYSVNYAIRAVINYPEIGNVVYSKHLECMCREGSFDRRIPSGS